MSYFVRILDHHGVLHGGRSAGTLPFCAEFTDNGAPWGCTLYDEVGPKFVGDEANPEGARPCPICFHPDELR